MGQSMFLVVGIGTGVVRVPTRARTGGWMQVVCSAEMAMGRKVSGGRMESNGHYAHSARSPS